MLLMSPALTAATLSYSSSVTSNTRGSIVSLNVTAPDGIILTNFEHIIRGQDGVRAYSLYYRVGAYDEPIDVGTSEDPNVQPAHRVESAWTQIGLAEEVSIPTSAIFEMPLNMNDASGGTLTLPTE
jgi:hypothetical protein